MNSLTPHTRISLTTREWILVALFIGSAAFAAGGAWIKISMHEANGHDQYNKAIQEINIKLARIETKLDKL